MTGKDNPFHYYPDFLTSSILELQRYENERHYKHDHQAPRRPRRERQGLHQGSQLHIVERKYRQAGHSRVASEPRTMRQGHHAYGGRGQKSLRSIQGNLRKGIKKTACRRSAFNHGCNDSFKAVLFYIPKHIK